MTKWRAFDLHAKQSATKSCPYASVPLQKSDPPIQNLLGIGVMSFVLTSRECDIGYSGLRPASFQETLCPTDPRDAGWQWLY